MVTNKKIESVYLESFLYFIIESIVNSLNVRIIALKRLQSSVKEVSIPNIYKDYVVTHRQTDRQSDGQTDGQTDRQTDRQTQTDYYNLHARVKYCRSTMYMH